MEEINLKELFKYYWNKKFIILCITIISVLFGVFYVTNLEKPLYHSSTNVILVNASSTDHTSSEDSTELSMNKQLVTTYSEIIKNSSILDSVIKELNLDMSTEELKNSINVTSVNNTEIIKIEVSNSDNVMAYNIAVRVTNTFIKKVNSIYNLENITILNEAKIEENPYNISIVKQTSIIGMIGLLLSLVILFLVFYFDTTIKSKEDIETKLNLLVLGSIAKVGDKYETQ